MGWGLGFAFSHHGLCGGHEHPQVAASPVTLIRNCGIQSACVWLSTILITHLTLCDLENNPWSGCYYCPHFHR